MGSTMVAVVLLVGVSQHAPDAGQHTPSYFEQKSAQVLASFLSFAPARTVVEAQNPLADARDRDALLLPAGAAPSLRGGALGAAVMGAAIVMVAHAPRRLRPLVDGRFHFGPALLADGGMGAGVGGRF